MTKRAGPRYAIIPADAVTDEKLSGPDLKVLALLGRHIDRRGWCVRSQGRMADELRIARGTLQRSLGRLVDASYVEVSHEKRRDGGQAANRYRVILDEDARADQLDLFFGADAVRPARSAGREESVGREAPPASPAGHPLPHPGKAPPASPRRGTHMNDPFETSPSDSRAQPRGAIHGDPANDLAPFLPDAVPVGRDVDGRALAEQLRGAAGTAINSAHPAFLNLAEPYGWLAAGCDLTLDVIPTLAGVAARHSGPPVRSWRYFAGAVTEARDRRLSAARPAVPSTQIMTLAGEPDGPRPPAGRFAAHFARRRAQLAGSGS